MTIDANGLLKLLGSSPRVRGMGLSQSAAPASGVEAGQFAELLKKARNGELSSNQPVTIAADAASQVKLTDDQLAKIALAADKAEASGVRKALVVLDDQQVLLDVSSRTITGAASSADVIADVDGVINLTSSAQAAPTPPLPPPAATLSSLSLSKLLAQTA